MDYSSRSVGRWKLLPLATLTGVLTLLAPQGAAKTDAAAQVRRADAAIASAASQDVGIFAPAAFSEAVREYRAAENALKNKQDSEASSSAERAIKLAEKATSVATKTRALLKDTVSLRSSVAELNSNLSAELTEADEILKQAAAAAEAGDRNKAIANGAKASDAYSTAAKQYVQEQWLPSLRKQIAEVDSEASGDQIARARAELDSAESSIAAAKPAELFLIVDKLKGIDHVLYPPFFRLPPSQLQMGDFVLQVIRYDSRRWDFQNGLIIHASGTAWLVFHCQPTFPLPPLWQVATIERDLRVVETVKDPLAEIAFADALRVDPAVVTGSTVTMKLPSYAASASQVSQAVRQQIQWLLRPAGGIEVHFDDLTIQPAGIPDTGRVLAGTAAYPTAPPDPADASLSISGFRLLLHTINLTPSRASVAAQLEMPTSVVDPGTGHPGRVDLGTFPITSSCVFRRELPQLAYGPWSVGNTGMQVKGTGVTADFDPVWAAPEAPAGSPAATPSWRGALLGQGTTAARSPVISNSGYLSASYSYPIALVAALGLSGQFRLIAPYEFESLEPLGYRVFISTGSLNLADSAVKDGRFDPGKLVLPQPAVVDTSGGPVVARHDELQLNANLDLLGSATLAVPIRWGEFILHPISSSTFYESQGFKYGRFYLSGTQRTNYFPVDAADNFLDPGAIINPLPAIGLQGLTVFFPEILQIDTPDTPSPTPLHFVSTNQSDRASADWLNFSFGGVHGNLQHFLSAPNTNTELGPVYQAFYQGQKPFEPGLGSGANKKLEKRFSLAIKFVSSSVYDANMQGAVALPDPINGTLDFTQMEFTSTAQISGAKLPMNSPLPLSYWGLDVVKKPGTTSAGVMSVRTGQIFFTAAGIRELRHFATPFYLTWGELLASGAVHRLIFDYNGAGQKFDRFGYTTSFVKLSDYDTAKKAYLKTAGTVAFDVFGAKYININDTYEPTKTGDPYNKRSVTLANDSDPSGPYSATDHSLHSDWGNGFGTFAYTYDYDINAQDGFIGPGTMALQWVDQTLQSSIVLKAERTCLSANDTNRHDVTLGPVAHFGAMNRITGCGCIVNHQLERMVLSAELENTTDANIVLRSASYGEVQMMFTPSISSVEFLGDIYLTLLTSGNVEVQGHAKFTVNRDQDFVEGDVDGHFDAASALGLNSVSGDGHVNWHIGMLGGTGYESLQGQLSLNVVTPLAGTSAEGGLYIGINAPLSEAWVLSAAGPHFKLNTSALPARLTGLYGYVKAGKSINLYVLSGGYEEFIGLGGFVLTPQQASNLHAQSTVSIVGLPYVVGNVGAHAWGDILGGLVSADGWADLQLMLPYPFSFQGDIDLSACVLWVACGDVDVTVGLNSTQGLYLQ
jgi:hypothetical protein